MQFLKRVVLSIMGYGFIYPVLNTQTIGQNPWLFALVILGACCFVASGAIKD